MYLLTYSRIVRKFYSIYNVYFRLIDFLFAFSATRASHVLDSFFHLYLYFVFLSFGSSKKCFALPICIKKKHELVL